MLLQENKHAEYLKKEHFLHLDTHTILSLNEYSFRSYHFLVDATFEWYR